MTLLAAENVRVYLEGYDLSGLCNKLSVAAGKRDFEDITGFGAGGHKWFPTLADQGFNLDAFWDVDDIVQVMNTLRGATGVICLGYGSALSSPAVCGVANQEDFSVESPVDGMLKISTPFKFNGKADTGIILEAKGTAKAIDGEGTIVNQTTYCTKRSGMADATEAFKLHDADGGFGVDDVGLYVYNTTDKNFALITAFVDSGELTLDTDTMTETDTYIIMKHNRYAAFLQVFSVSTDDSVIVSIRHSNDNFVGDDTELIAFTSATARGAERKIPIVSTAVKPYIRAKWDVTGTSVAIVLAVCFCRVLNQG